MEENRHTREAEVRGLQGRYTSDVMGTHISEKNYREPRNESSVQTQGVLGHAVSQPTRSPDVPCQLAMEMH